MRKILYFLLLTLAWASLASPQASAQTCTTAATTLDYNAVATGSRKTGTDAVGTATVTYSAFSSTVTGTNTNTFAVGPSTVLSSSGNFLVWQQNDVGVSTSNASTITLTFSRPVSNLKLVMTDIDRDTDPNNFIDRVTFDGYANLTGGSPLTLVAGDVTVGINNANRFVGSGSNYTSGTTPAYKSNAVTGIATSSASRDSDVIITFPSAVRRVVLTYENIAPYVSSTTDRTQTTGLVSLSWCRLAPVANNVTTATIPSTAGQVGIKPLNATAEGTIASYLVKTIPNATTQGTLYYNSTGTTYTAVTANQTLTPDQAASLRYFPLNAASGNATFTYSATDDAGLVTNTATYTIPVSNTVCATAPATFSFSTRPVGEDWKAHAATPAPSGVTTVGSGGYTTPGTATASTLQVGTVNGATSLRWYTDYASQTENTSTVTFNFNRPVSNFAVQVQDVDRSENSTNAFIDQVTFLGANGSTTVTPVVGPANPNTCSTSISGNVATGTTSVTATSSTDGTVIAYFPGPVTSITLTYRNTSTYATDPTQQAIGIDLLSWCRLAPVANNVTTASLANTAGTVAIPSLSSTVDGTVQYYTLASLPPAAQGILYVNGTVATLNQQLTAAQAALLTFAPATTFSGNATFTYSVTDDASLTSAALATYTVPVTAAGAAGTPAPCATPGKDLSLTTTASTGVLNTYYSPESAVAGATQLNLGSGRGNSKAVAANDLLLVIQMQGGDFDYADNTSSYGTGQPGSPVNGAILSGTFVAGQYEYVQVASVAGNTVTLKTPLLNSYQNTDASSTAGQRSFQVVRVPQYVNLTLGANLLPSPWNGSTGGIVALDVAGQLSLGTYSINANGAGFRGGAGRVLGGDATATATTTDYRSSASLNVHGTKGEGILGTPRYVSDPAYSTTALLDTRTAATGFPALLNSGQADGYPGGDNARGAPGNAGGGGTDGEIGNNQQNSGGGGGANGGAGGRGGNTWSGNAATGGEPGAAFPSASSSRLVLGGGGGAGTTNNGTGDASNTGFASSGGNGGGLVLVRTGTVSSNGGGIVANGSAPAGTPDIDGAGGGGAGGSILLTTNGSTAGLAALTLSATGGNGGSNTATSLHGPGGGGGGGIIFTNGAVAAASSAAAGASGTTTGGSAYGAAAGTTGTRNAGISRAVAGSVAGATCITEIAASLTGPTTLLAGQATGTYTATFTNEGPQDASSVAQTVTLPTGASLSATQQQALTTRYGLTTGSFTTTGTGATAVTVINFGTAGVLASGTANAFSFAFTAPAAVGSSTLTDNTSTSSNEAVNLAPNAASLTLTTTAVADLVVTLTPSATTPVAPGSAASFALSVLNNGTQEATGTTATVQLPAGLTAYGTVAASNGGSYNNTTGLVTYGTFALPAGSMGMSTISFTMPTSGVVTATASATTTTPEASYANNTAPASLATAVQLDLSTSISGPTTAVAGSPITLNVTTTNNGPQATTGALQTVELPQGLTGVYVSNSGYYNATASAVTGNFVDGNFVIASGGSITIVAGTVAFPPTGILPVGQTLANTITFNSPAGTLAVPTYSPVARVAAQTGETSTTNNVAYLNGAANTTAGIITPGAATLTTANVYAILRIASETLPDGTSTTATVVPATTKVTYTAGVGNDGTNVATSTASNVTQQLQLVPGLGVGTLTVGGNAGTASGTGNSAIVTYSYGSVTATYNVTTGVLTLPTLTSLASDASSSTAVVVTLPATLPNDGRLLATMSVGSATSDKIPADNVKATTIRVLPITDLVTTLTGPASAVPGQPVSYTATFLNNGPDAATSTAETVQLPAGLSTVTVTDNTGAAVAATYTAATGLLTLPAIASDAVGATQVFNLAFTAPAQSYTVSSTVGTTTLDTAPANNAATMPTAVTPAADVAVSITGPATAVAGTLVNYTVTTTNNGATPAATVATTLQLPAGLSNVVVSGAGTYSTSGLVTFDALASQPAGTSQVNYVTFTMPASPSGGQVPGTAKATTTSTDLVPGNNAAGIVTTLAPTTAEPANLKADITTMPTSPAAPGSTLSYVFAFSNTGSLDVDNVQQQAGLPAGLTAGTLKVATQTGTLNTTSGLLVFPNGATYNATTGALTLPPGTLKAGAATSYAVAFPAPASGPVVVTTTVASGTSESTIIDNQDSNSTTITPSYDATTGLSGPTTALPGAAVTYAVTTTNNGPSTVPSVTQTVTLPKNLTTASLLVAGQTGTLTGGVINYSNTGATYTQSTGVLAFPAITYLATGAANTVTNSFTVTMPASGSLALTAAVTSAGESNTGNNTATLTTTAANRPPVAQNIVNSLQSARANNAVALPISSLVAADPDGTIAATNGYTIVSLPTTAEGTLYYNGTAATVGQAITDASKLSFKPTSGFVGNAFFTYSATDNLLAASTPALYTIPVSPDVVSAYTATTVKGGLATYKVNDVVTYLIDPNGAVYNNQGLVYSPDGTAATQTADLPLSNGVTGAVAVPNAGPTGNTANTLPTGISLNATTGQLYVSDPTKLAKTGGTYSVNITTTDANGGTNIVTETFSTGANPLPVTLTVFTAQPVQNRDALLKWTTASEVNNDHFDVERSFDGLSFAKIGAVAGQGTKPTATSYTLTDAGVAAKATGPVYYRLRQVDVSGTATYSPVRAVSFTADGVAPAIGLYPNPVATTTELDLMQLPTGTYQVTLLDATGRLVRSYSLAAGLTHSLDLHEVAGGTYLLLVRGTAPAGTPLQFVARLLKD
ncbi:MAG: hypothetical protein ACRYFX_29440 [Janthinobacterium lividum]